MRRNQKISICNEYPATTALFLRLLHFFVTCPVAKQVWEEADKLISVLSGRKTVLTERIKIFGIFESDSSYSESQKVVLWC